MGKLAASELQKLLECIKADSRVLVPPMIGYDAGVHKMGDLYVAVATDPCTGVPKDWFGYLLINYAASDVALFGAKPQFCTITLLGPPETKTELFQEIMRQTCRAADELGIAIVRGHTGMYGSVNEVVGVCTVYGTVKPEQLITPGNAKAGDLILATKPLGLETAVNFSIANKPLAQKLLGKTPQEALSSQVCLQSCVGEALMLAEVGGVHAMHDATEGGFLAALNELAESSRVGFRVDWEKLPISPEVSALQNHFKFSDEEMLALSSTGTILAAVDSSARDKVSTALGKIGLSAFFLGEFTENKKRVLIREGKETVFPLVAQDPYSQILSRQ